MYGRMNRNNELIGDSLLRISSNPLLQGLNYHKDAIAEHFKRTGKCNLQLGKEGLMNVMGSFALQKNSEYTKTVNQG